MDQITRLTVMAGIGQLNEINADYRVARRFDQAEQ
jgi:hypothetical protein